MPKSRHQIIRRLADECQNLNVESEFAGSDLKFNPGFTLIEVLLAIVIFTVISMGLVALVSNIFFSSSKQSALLADTDQARKVAFGIINQLRNAQSSSVGAYAVQTAEEQNLVFYSNIDSDPLIERVRYYVQNGKLYEAVLKPSGNPLSYNPANEQVSIAQNNIANNSEPLFYYYDGDFEGSGSSLTQPVNVTEIKFVKLNLKIFNKAGIQGTNFYSVTAGGSVRNLKTNLAELVFPPGTEFTMATSVAPSNSGRVAVSPAGPNYPAETLVYLSSYPNLGYWFSSWTGNVASTTASSTTIVMLSNENIVANFNSISETLTGSVYSKSGNLNNRKWTLRIHNNTSHWIDNLNLYSFTLTHTSGTYCTPILTSPAAFPAYMGTISAGGNRNYDIRINFTGCNATSRFTANFTFAGNNGLDWGSEAITGLQY